MKGKGYSEFTPEGAPSTIYQYCYMIERLMERERIKSYSELTVSLRKWIKWLRGSGKLKEKKYWKTQYPELINALETFEWYLLDRFEEYQEYLIILG